MGRIMRRLSAGILALYGHAAVAESTLQLSIPLAGNPTALPAILRQPDGPGPFPAVVMLHDCSGLGPRSSGAPARWATDLVQAGFAVLLPDSFSPRGLPDGVCVGPVSQTARASPGVRAEDARAALAALRTQPHIDGRRIGIMGGSHGGSSTLGAMLSHPAQDRTTQASTGTGYAAGIALYPGCAADYGDWKVYRHRGQLVGPPAGYAGAYAPSGPVLILIGEQDDWTPAEPCLRMVEASRAAGHPVDIKVYPGAHHSFDSDRPVRYVAERNNASSWSGRGATTGGNPVAWEDARQQVRRFFVRHLMPDR